MYLIKLEGDLLTVDADTPVHIGYYSSAYKAISGYIDALKNGQWQKCPKCDGQGTVSKPPWVPGDVMQWESTSTSFPCDVCNGMKIIKQ